MKPTLGSLTRKKINTNIFFIFLTQNGLKFNLPALILSTLGTDICYHAGWGGAHVCACMCACVLGTEDETWSLQMLGEQSTPQQHLQSLVSFCLVLLLCETRSQGTQTD